MFTTVALLLALSALAQCDHQLDLAKAVANFGQGFKSVGLLADAMELTNEQDVHFFNQIGNTTQQLESQLFQQVLESATGYEKMSVMRAFKNQVSDKWKYLDTCIVKQIVPRSIIICLFVLQHYNTYSSERGQSIPTRIALEVVSAMPQNSLVGMDFAQGMLNMDKSSTDLLYKTIMMNGMDEQVKTRPKRAIRWACSLLKMASVTGLGESKLSDMITTRVPERWQGAVRRALESGGAKKLIQLASFLCQFTGGAETGSVSYMYSHLSHGERSQLMHVFEHSFIQHNVDFDRFVAYTQWLQAAIGNAFEAVY